jgi:hypothetical protein
LQLRHPQATYVPPCFSLFYFALTVSGALGRELELEKNKRSHRLAHVKFVDETTSNHPPHTPFLWPAQRWAKDRTEQGKARSRSELQLRRFCCGRRWSVPSAKQLGLDMIATSSISSTSATAWFLCPG